MTHTPRIVLDFDGVLNSYRSGWISAAEIPDPPTAGAQQFVADLLDDGWEIVIQSTRAATPQGANAISEWLILHGFPLPGGPLTADPRGAYVITAEKLPALVYLDDRALRFNGPGTWPTREILETACVPWTMGVAQ